MRQLHFDLLRLLEDDRQGSHGTRPARRHVLAQAAETLHRLGYRGLRARGFKGRHVVALVAEWRMQGLSDGTVRNRMAHLRWLARRIGKPGIVRKDNASCGIGPPCGTFIGVPCYLGTANVKGHAPCELSVPPCSARCCCRQAAPHPISHPPYRIWTTTT